MVCCLLSEWCVVTSFYQSLQAMSSFVRFSICATYCTLSPVDQNGFAFHFFSHHDILHSFDPPPGKSGDDKSPAVIFVTTGLCKISIFSCSGERQTESSRDVLHGCSYFNQISVRVIKSDYLLPPTVCHQTIDIFGFGVEQLKSCHKFFYIGFFKI